MWRLLCPLAFFFPFSAQFGARFQSTIAANESSARPLVLQGRSLRPVDQASRTRLSFQRKLRRMLAVAAIAGPVALAPQISSAENLLEFFFGGGQKQQQPSLFGNIFNNNAQPAPPRPVAASSGPAFCVRSCDGKYFPLMRGAASPSAVVARPSVRRARPRFSSAPTSTAPMPQPANATPIAKTPLPTGKRCAPITHLQRPKSRRPGAGRSRDGRLVALGDVLATADGNVAYSGSPGGNDQNRISRR